MRSIVVCALALACLAAAPTRAETETDPARLIQQAEAARQIALASDADRLFPAAWEAAERRLREARTARERGNQARAQQRAIEAREAYLAAELMAIEGRLLSRARAEIAEAQAARVDRLAPVTLGRARTLLAEAEETLAVDRRATETAAALAARAEAYARHSRSLAEAIQTTRSRDGSVELALLERETPLRAAAREAGLENAEAGSPAALGRALIEHVAGLEARLARQETLLDEANQRILAMDEELRELDSQLGGVARERSELIMALEAQAQLRGQYARLESLFSRDEAIVLREGERVIIRLVGLNFPTNSAAIPQEARPLLARLAEAGNIFPQARFTIEGHTDSRGSAQLNLRLSQDRADAVLRYMVEQHGLGEFRLRAVGLGSSRPIASDDTEDGRARNRRIDITFAAPTPP